MLVPFNFHTINNAIDRGWDAVLTICRVSRASSDFRVRVRVQVQVQVQIQIQIQIQIPNLWYGSSQLYVTMRVAKRRRRRHPHRLLPYLLLRSATTPSEYLSRPIILTLISQPPRRQCSDDAISDLQPALLFMAPPTPSGNWSRQPSNNRIPARKVRDDATTTATDNLMN